MRRVLRVVRIEIAEKIRGFPLSLTKPRLQRWSSQPTQQTGGGGSGAQPKLPPDEHRFIPFRVYPGLG